MESKDNIQISCDKRNISYPYNCMWLTYEINYDKLGLNKGGKDILSKPDLKSVILS